MTTKAAAKPKVLIIKKKGKGHAHHGGAWKVAYADFVTAMMALFMVLWLVSQSDQQTRSALSNYFRTGVFQGGASPLESGAGPQPGSPGASNVGGQGSEQNSLEHHAAEIEAALDNAIAADPALSPLREQVQVLVTNDGLLVQITDDGEDLLFDLSSARLKPALLEFLQHIGPVLATMPNTIEVHGHTDARPYASNAGKTNWDLSFERADVARDLLERSGLRDGQIVGVFAHGSTDLIADPMDARNRRLAILARRRAPDPREPESK